MARPELIMIINMNRQLGFRSTDRRGSHFLGLCPWEDQGLMLGTGKGKMTNFNYKRVSKSQQEDCAAQIFLRNWTSSSVFGLIDIRFYFFAPNTL